MQDVKEQLYLHPTQPDGRWSRGTPSSFTFPECTDKSQEVRSGERGRDHSLAIWHRVKYHRGLLVSRRELQNAGHIATAITIVGSWPYRYQLVIKHVPKAWWKTFLFFLFQEDIDHEWSLSLSLLTIKL